ncbi:MAG: type II and III secretion system protein family protein [Steroidobacteraceae bacterium]
MSNNISTMVARVAVSTLATLMAMTGIVGSARAQTAAFQTLPTGASINMSIPLFKSRVVVVDLPTGRVAVGNPDVADIVVINPTQLYVLAKDIGTTNVLFWSRDNRLIGSINLEVVHDLDGLKSKLHQLMPDEPIEVYSAQRSIILKGRATNVSSMNAAVRIADGYLAQIQTAKKAQEFEQETASAREDKSVGQVINLIEVAGSQQVMLEVKVAEIARTELKRLHARFNAISKGADGAFGGVNGGASFPDVLFAPDNVRLPALPGNAPWGPAIDEFAPNDMTIVNQGLFGTFINDNFLFNLAVDAAKEKGLAKVLAEPTLTTLTGQEAEFLSGGQFPIPVSNGLNGVTIEFKKFGVGLKFLPVVLSDNRINMKINVSVSELVDTASLVLESEGSSRRTFVPSLRERSASATVELGDGQSMGLAGLLDDNLRSLVTKFPGLGDVPILGALFRSNQFQKGQTELVIMVTPRLAKPVAPGSVTLPTDEFVEPSDAEFYWQGKLEGKPAAGGHQVK